MENINYKNWAKGIEKFIETNGGDAPYYEVEESIVCSGWPDKYDENLARSIINFLNAWKCRLKKENAVIELEKKLKEINQKYKKLVGKVLESYIRGADESTDSIITDIFETLKETRIKLEGKKVTERKFGPTAASKIMHILNPHFFVMWDSNIRKAYNKTESSDDYLDFLNAMADVARKVIPYYSDLNNTYYQGKKTLSKLLDEYMYSKYAIVLPKKKEYLHTLHLENENNLIKILEREPFDEIASLIKIGRKSK